MTFKTTFIATVLISSFSLASLASGEHGSHGKMTSHKAMTMDDNKHGDTEGSPVGKPAPGTAVTKTIAVTTPDRSALKARTLHLHSQTPTSPVILYGPQH